MSAILFGSISTIADTSELQRHAFNAAFVDHGLSWHWKREEYIDMLRGSGGADRIAHYASARGETIDAAAVHLTKSSRFQASLAATQLEPRPGVVDTIIAAKGDGMKVALVTTTSQANLEALAHAVESRLPFSDFDLITDVSDVTAAKPSKAAYVFALEQLAETASRCVAVEDNMGGVNAARSAGIVCIAFPNENTAKHDFDAASRVVDRIDYHESRDLITGPAS